MGCIASKFMSPSMIFKGKLKQGEKRPGNTTIPAHPEIIKDHFLALVYTATTTKQVAATDNKSTWEYMSSPEQEPLKPKDEEKGVGRGRSFHTIEEYDSMVEKLKSCGGEEGDDCSDGDGYVIQEVQEQEQINEEDDGVEEKEEVLSVIQDTSSSTDTITSPPTAKSTRIQEQEDMSEKESGYKRKCIAKRLESLEIPESNDLPPVASLREWLQVHSPSPINERDDAFDPELVAACEECMQQLESEAEAILREITEAEEQEEEETK